MKIQAFLKTCYHYTIGCCCGSCVLETPEDETFLLVEVGNDGPEYQACLNDTVRVEVTGNGSPEEGTKETEPAKQVEPVVLDKLEDAKPEEVKPEDVKQAQEDQQEESSFLPVQATVPEPEPELNLEDPTRRVFKEDFVPGMFLPRKDGEMVQERFHLSSLEYLKSGSFGDVYKGRDDANQRFVVKVVNMKGHCEDEAVTSWFEETEKELQFLVSAKHENIVKLHDYFWIKHTINAVPSCLVMKTERLDFTLEDVLIKIDAPLPRLVTVKVAHQLGAALLHLHQNRIVNHDIKAQNVMVNGFKSLNRPKERLIKYLESKTCGIKMIDLGLGQQYSGEIRDCKDSTLLRFRKGAEKYQSLEKRINQSYEPFSADCFAFAVLLLETMMGYKKFEREYNSRCKEMFDPVTGAVKAGVTPHNFIIKIARQEFKKLERMNPISVLVVRLLEDETKRWTMEQAMEYINKKYGTIL